MAKPHKINFDEPALRALDAQKLRNFSYSSLSIAFDIGQYNVDGYCRADFSPQHPT
jgi:hypothetical protein